MLEYYERKQQMEHDEKMLESMMNVNEIQKNFSYHAPKPGQPEKYTVIRDHAKGLAFLINDNCPDSREKSLAMTKLEECVMWANASIARNT